MRPLSPRKVFAHPARIGAMVVIVGAAMLATVDLAPRVEPDFFFASDDPQLAASREIGRLFPGRPQILVDAAGEIASLAYLERLEGLSAAFEAMPGVAKVHSLVRGPRSPKAAREGGLWRRLLLPAAGEPGSSLLILEIEETDERRLVAEVEAAMARFESVEPRFELHASGVPTVIELVRRRLVEDLRTFSLVSLLVFGLGVALVYRSLPIVLGALVACLGAAVATLGTLELAGVAIGLLTANIATIVFVLTLSHTVFLAAAWRSRAAHHVAEAGGEWTSAAKQALAAAAVRATLPASFWCMATTLLGFASLLATSARPLRELGTAGALGSLVAFAFAFLVFPSFLTVARPPRPAAAQAPVAAGGQVAVGRPWLWAVGLAALLLALLPGLLRLETDPSLLAYFDRADPLRAGLAAIDREGGSSPLEIVVVDPAGARLDSKAGLERLARVQAAIEADPAVGTALSLPVLVEEARRSPLAGFFGPAQLLVLLEAPAFGGITKSFVTEDRLASRFFLRLREDGRDEPRQVIVERLAGLVRQEGLEPRLVGGLFDLQGKLARLVRTNLLAGLAALGLLFAAIAAALARRVRTAFAMVACLISLPFVMFGVMGYAGLPLDVIASPAANVAIGMGIDSMIHLVLAVRRRERAGLGPVQAWAAARAELRLPILAAAGVTGAGFGIFLLSSFPPTRHFGLAVLLGMAAAAALAIVVLPALAAARGRKVDSPPEGDQR